MALFIHPDQLSPLKEGSVQKMYAVKDNPGLMVSEIGDWVSIFDIGPFLKIPASGDMRALMRHQIYDLLSRPEHWNPGIFKELGNLNICRTFLRNVKEEGIKTHHLGILDRDTGAFVGGNPTHPGNRLLSEKFEVHQPTQRLMDGEPFHDYSPYPGKDGFIIPLEMIGRLGLPPNSSMIERYLNADAEGKEKLERKTGLPELKAWALFESPLIDFTTKYESMDRSLGTQEACYIFNLCGADIQRFLDLMKVMGVFLKYFFESLSLKLWDFKLEFAIRNGQPVLVDTIDPDSCRTTLEVEDEGRKKICHFNKQAIRDYYILFHPSWMEKLGYLKKQCRDNGLNFQREFWKRADSEEIYRVPKMDERFLHLQSKKQETLVQRMRHQTEEAEFKEQIRQLALEEHRLKSVKQCSSQ